MSIAQASTATETFADAHVGDHDRVGRRDPASVSPASAIAVWTTLALAGWGVILAPVLLLS